MGFDESAYAEGNVQGVRLYLMAVLMAQKKAVTVVTAFFCSMPVEFRL